jgi:hypothetical protein
LTLPARVVESYAPADQESVSAWRVWAELWVHRLRELSETIYGEWRDIVIGLVRAAQDQGQLASGSRDMTVPRRHETCQAYLRGLSGSTP